MGGTASPSPAHLQRMALPRHPTAQLHWAAPHPQAPTHLRQAAVGSASSSTQMGSITTVLED